MPITTPATYTNTDAYEQQTIIAEVSNNDIPAYKSTTSFIVDVFDMPLPSLAVNILNLTNCNNTSVGTDTNGRVIFDVTQRQSLF